jgi:hypothetical protein
MKANGSGAQKTAASARERRQALEELEKSGRFFANVTRRHIEFEHLAAGVERSYRRARHKFRGAYENPSDEAFHEWRKTVQQHWRHMQLLSRGWPDVLGGRADEAKELSRLLGEDHDIHVLLAYVAERGKAALSPEEMGALENMGRTIQDELRELAKPRGARLFAEPASQVKDQLVLYWSAARDLSLLSPKENGKEPRTTQKRNTVRHTAAQAASRGERAAGSRRSGR